MFKLYIKLNIIVLFTVAFGLFAIHKELLFLLWSVLCCSVLCLYAEEIHGIQICSN